MLLLDGLRIHSKLGNVLMAAFFAAVLSACGSNAPTAPSSTTTPAPVPAPIAAANIVLPAGAGLSVPGCDANRRMAALMGLPSATCFQFNGILRNSGSGCAANVRGTTRTYADPGMSRIIGSAGWSYSSMVRPNEQFSYSGGVIDVPSNGDFYFVTTASWDNTRCQ
jgi:hypothetical protein